MSENAEYLISSGPLSATMNYQIIVRGTGAINSKTFERLIQHLEIDREILAECERDGATQDEKASVSL